MTSPGTFLRTVRHLRARQVIGRMTHRLSRPTLDRRPAPPLHRAAGGWAVPAARESSLEGNDRFCFLNECHDLSAIGWDDPALEKLWRYNLHYFDDLNAGGAAARAAAHRALIDRWIAENPPPAGSGWEPYPTSLRIVNWVKFFLSGARPEAAWLDNLACQTRWLAQRLEWHLLGNHLFVNAKALVMAGLFFEGEEARIWLATGRKILMAELAEQILPDGGQFERSPMYHVLAVEDVLDLLNMLRWAGRRTDGLGELSDALAGRAPAMIRWMRAMNFSDGGVTHFNDSADGIAPTQAEIERYAADIAIEAPSLPPGDIHLADSGYVRLAAGPALAWLDVAPIGPSYLPGHAHADTLSFELEVGGERLLLNGGTSVYGLSERRLLERGTARHNCVELAGRDSSEVWSGFRVGRRAHVHGIERSPGRVAAAHDGYRFLPGRPVHRRSWTIDADQLVVEDVVTGGRGDARAYFHLAPGITATEETPGNWTLYRGDAVAARLVIEHAVARLVASDHAPRFGVVQSTQALRCDMPDGRCTTRWIWKP